MTLLALALTERQCTARAEMQDRMVRALDAPVPAQIAAARLSNIRIREPGADTSTALAGQGVALQMPRNAAPAPLNPVPAETVRTSDSQENAQAQKVVSAFVEKRTAVDAGPMCDGGIARGSYCREVRPNVRAGVTAGRVPALKFGILVRGRILTGPMRDCLSPDDRRSPSFAGPIEIGA